MFFYNSLLNCVCSSPSYDSISVTSLLTFDSFEQAKDFLERHLCYQFHKSTFYYSDTDNRTFMVRKFYGMNYYGIVCYSGDSRFYLPRIYEF